MWPRRSFGAPSCAGPTFQRYITPNATEEIKLDGYRAIAVKTGGKLYLRSRNDNDFGSRYPAIAGSLNELPDETVIDGEIVALDEKGRPSFNLLQTHGSSAASIIYYVFDVLILAGHDVMKEPVTERRRLLEGRILPNLNEPVRYSISLDASLQDLISSVKAHGLEGLVAKRRDSRYEPGKRSGAWQKMRVNRAQDFVIGGYTVGGTTFDALIFGYYEGNDLMYAARTRSGFTSGLRRELLRRFRTLEVSKCPFVNLPETKAGRWGVGLTAAKMKECRWLNPVLVGQFEFLEWTADGHLRHSKFMALREGRTPRDVGRE